MLVRDYMTPKPVCVSPDTSIKHTIQLMLDHNVSGLPVIGDDDQVIGMLTESDLLSRSVFIAGLQSPPRDPDNAFFENYVRTHGTTVGDCMTTGIISVSPQQSLADVAALARSHGIKRLPVLQSGKLIGIISRRDILRAVTANRDCVATGDVALRLAVATRLRSELGLETDRLTVEVKNAIVEISGPVPSPAQRRAMQVVAESVAGVAGINFRH
ncbi:MAG TPA: CBS domain-containing protein [Pararhizobium sp.]|uniref:CBS domain-containing protein n=1 Tax=Pararhizobium sp. TaxID=1977563 RepID=UPI002CBAE016|nr:CBS domain-containing protein [Pararhizobium sp.]HTO33107.1 CBS domain-containing protein [Pararhizobium sp.]